MEALILAGGYGTRLRPLTLKTPKELLPLLSKPEIDYLLENLSRHGVKRAHLSLNDVFAEAIKAHVGDGRRFHMSIDYIVEETHGEGGKLGAVGALEYIGKRIRPREDLLIIGADNFSPQFDFTRMEISHKASGCEITIALHKLAQKELLPTLGVAEILPSGKILRFHEKPEKPVSDLVSTAIYLVSPDFLTRFVPDFVEYKRTEGKKPDNLGDMWEHLLRSCDFLNGYVSKEFWMDIGKPQGYLLANEYLLDRKYGKRAVFDGSAKIGAGVKTNGGAVLVEANTRIGNNVIFEKHNHVMTDVEIGEGALLQNCLVFPHAKIEPGCRLKNCIVSENSVVTQPMAESEEHRVVGT